MDRNGPKRANDQSGLNGANGLKWTQGTEVDRNGPKRWNDQSGLNGPKWTKMDQS